LATLLQDGHTTESVSGLRRFARALGQLATVTAGHEPAFDSRLRHVSQGEPQNQRRGVSPEIWSRTRDYMGAISMEPSSAVERDVARVMNELTDPGPFLTLSNGDAGPNNYMISDDDGRLIDFEAAGYRHAAKDAVFLHVPGPHWITASNPVVEGTETEFRAALCDAIPEAQDDKRFGTAMPSPALPSRLAVGSGRNTSLTLAGIGCRSGHLCTLHAKIARAGDAPAGNAYLLTLCPGAPGQC
jgi:hypothetical protein